MIFQYSRHIPIVTFHKIRKFPLQMRKKKDQFVRAMVIFHKKTKQLRCLLIFQQICVDRKNVEIEDWSHKNLVSFVFIHGKWFQGNNFTEEEEKHTHTHTICEILNFVFFQNISMSHQNLKSLNLTSTHNLLSF